MTKTRTVILAVLSLLYLAGPARAETPAPSTQQTPGASQAPAHKFTPPDPKALLRDHKERCDMIFHQMKIPKDQYDQFMAGCVRKMQTMQRPIPAAPNGAASPTAKTEQ